MSCNPAHERPIGPPARRLSGPEYSTWMPRDETCTRNDWSSSLFHCDAYCRVTPTWPLLCRPSLCDLLAFPSSRSCRRRLSSSAPRKRIRYAGVTFCCLRVYHGGIVGEVICRELDPCRSASIVSAADWAVTRITWLLLTHRVRVRRGCLIPSILDPPHPTFLSFHLNP